MDSVAKIEDFIGRGKANAITRDELAERTGIPDRHNRRLIAEAVEKRGVPIINIGNGYFIATEDDYDELRAYYRQEQARAKRVFKRIMTLKRVIEHDPNQYKLEG